MTGGGEERGGAGRHPLTPLGRAPAALTAARRGRGTAGAERPVLPRQPLPARAGAARAAGQFQGPVPGLPAAGRHGSAGQGSGRRDEAPGTAGGQRRGTSERRQTLPGAGAAGRSPLPASDGRTSRQGEWVPQCPPGPGSAHEPWCPHRLPPAPRSPGVEGSGEREEAEPAARAATPRWAGAPRAGPGPPRRAGQGRSRAGVGAPRDGGAPGACGGRQRPRSGGEAAGQRCSGAPHTATDCTLRTAPVPRPPCAPSLSFPGGGRGTERGGSNVTQAVFIHSWQCHGSSQPCCPWGHSAALQGGRALAGAAPSRQWRHVLSPHLHPCPRRHTQPPLPPGRLPLGSQPAGGSAARRSGHCLPHVAIV